MTIFPKQRTNLFLAAFIAGLAAGTLSTGFMTAEDPTFVLVLGCAVALAGVVQIYQELTQTPAPGSSDLLLGAGQLVGGAAMALQHKNAANFIHTALCALCIFYALTVLQLAANLRKKHKKKAKQFALAGAVPFVLAVLPLVPPIALGAHICLYAACAALVFAGVVVAFLLPFEQEAAKEQAKKLAAAEKKAEKPAPKPLTAEEQAAKEEAARQKAEQAAKEAEARKKAEAARKAKEAKEEAEAEAEAMNLLAGLGSLAGKAKKRAAATAKNTVAGFKDGLHDGEKK